ncbi:MAG: GGDEF domain-containing protein [Alphaproteobacteria bacterium]|nr:GGDEF domain-containing protein [Alphaproteobacteria bacterium]
MASGSNRAAKKKPARKRAGVAWPQRRAIDRKLARLALALVETKRALARAQDRVAELEKQADEDPLMPIANRRAFLRELARMVAFAARYDIGGSVIYLDLDNLKTINDTHGHAAGDAALLQVARLLTETVRASDVVGRLGGDELGVLLVQADREAAERKAAEFARRIEAEPLHWQGRRVPLTIAFGVHAFASGENAEEVIAAADRAMYRNKRAAERRFRR